MDWSCNAKTLNIGEQVQHSRLSYEGDQTFAIAVKLNATGGDMAAILEVSFSADWGDYTKLINLSTGEHAIYEDHDYIEWQVHLDQVLGDTANIRICFEDYPRAAGIITSLNVPLEAATGDHIKLCATIKNVGNAEGQFYLKYFGSIGLVGTSGTYSILPGQSEVDICRIFTMLDDAWIGMIYVMRIEQ